MSTDKGQNNKLFYICVAVLLILAGLAGYIVYTNINLVKNPMDTLKRIGKNAVVNTLIAGLAVGIVTVGHIPGTLGTMAVTALSTVLKETYHILA